MLRSREINLSFFFAGYGDRTRTAGVSGERANHYTTNYLQHKLMLCANLCKICDLVYFIVKAGLEIVRN